MKEFTTKDLFLIEEISRQSGYVEARELNKLGIYWDDSYGCYRKKK